MSVGEAAGIFLINIGCMTIIYAAMVLTDHNDETATATARKIIIIALAIISYLK